MAHSRILDTLKTMAVLAAATAIGFLLETLGLSQANIITVYILGVLVVAAVTASRWYSISASLASVLLFNYIFTEPMFVLKAEDAGTQLTLLITFLAAVFTSSFTVQMKEKARLHPGHQPDAPEGRCTGGYPDLYRHTAEQAAQKGHYLL